MNRRRSRFSPALSVADAALESRVVQSGMTTGAIHQGAVEVAAQTLKKASTHTTLSIGSGTLGQPITFDVTVRAAASAGAPAGTVEILDHGSVIQTLMLSPTTAARSRTATSGATATLIQPPGGPAYYFGKHALTAEFIPSGAFAKSAASKIFTVGQPAYTRLADGVKVATIAQGSGPAIQSGQTASVLYTGYLAKNGQIFDASLKDGGSPFSFALGSGQVIPGFDQGTTGMKVGETRVVMIPAAEGYGHTASGAIPANSTLIFVLTLESIN